MNEKKYVVPEGMRRAVAQAVFDESGRCDYHPKIRIALEAAVRWLAENPIAPTYAQAQEMSVAEVDFDKFTNRNLIHWGAVEWQRRMFLAPEPEIPEAVKDLLCDPVNAGRGLRFGDMADKVNDAIIEAYRRGALSHDEK